MAPSDLKHWLLVMRSHVVLLVACTLVAAFASGGLTMLKEKEYTATAKVLFNDPDFARRSIFSPPTDAARVLATYLQLEVLKEVSDLTSDAIADSRVDGASDLAPEDVSAMVSVVAVGDTDFVEIDATASGAKLSALVANIFARKLIAFRAERDRSKLNAAKRVAERKYDRLSLAEKASPDGQSLQQTVTRLGMIAALQTGNAEFVAPATEPTSPTSPKPARNAILGALLGLVAGLGTIALLERSKRPSSPR